MDNSEGIQPHRSILRSILGPPLETSAAPHQAISKPVGLAVFASDALSSTAYATEEILVVLAIAGSAYFGLSIPIALAIIGLLAILTISYRQTIHAYPNGGGAYIVARDNLGEGVAQVAAAALLMDYVLTVAVSISSGVAQIVSAFPVMAPFRVVVALVLLGIMAVINLRGVKESGRTLCRADIYFSGRDLADDRCRPVPLGDWKPADLDRCRRDCTKHPSARDPLSDLESVFFGQHGIDRR